MVRPDSLRTVVDVARHWPADLVNRQFVADRPNGYWETHLTSVVREWSLPLPLAR